MPRVERSHTMPVDNAQTYERRPQGVEMGDMAPGEWRPHVSKEAAKARRKQQRKSRKGNR